MALIWLLVILMGGAACWWCRLREKAVRLIAEERGIVISEKEIEDAVDRVIREEAGRKG